LLASQVFLAQKKIIAHCNTVGKPVIVATQMLESMIKAPRPTRAEVTDVANAVLDGADCVMLSGETANGMYPNESVSVMANICREAEAANWNQKIFEELVEVTPRPVSTPETIAAAAVNASIQQRIAAIICLTKTGDSGRWVAKYRPRCPIICVTPNVTASRQLHLSRGCMPLYYPGELGTQQHAEDGPKDVARMTNSALHKWQDSVDRRLRHGIERAHAEGILKLSAGEKVVLIQGSSSGAGFTNTLRIVHTEHYAPQKD
jgi:pyruvate kinase